MFNNIFKWSDGLPTDSTDLDAIHDNVSGEISAIDEKTSLADNDLVLIEDSAASNVKKKSKISTFLAKARSILFLNEITTPSTPASGQVSLYAKADGLPFVKNDAGVESPIALGGVWQDWTITPTGFSSDPTFYSRYCVTGKLCHCVVRNRSVGVSNSTDFTITLPKTAASTNRWYAFVSVYDNGAYQNNPGLLVINENGTTATIYKNNALDRFTASGNKTFRGEWFYEIA